MAFGPDGNFYVAQGKGSDPHKDASVIFQFSGVPAKGGSTLKFLGPSKGDLLQFAGPFDDSPEQIIGIYTPFVEA